MASRLAHDAVPGSRMGAQWPLVGRAGELRLLSGILSRADARGLVLAGPSGVGKTRLALEALSRADQLGLPTARISASRAAAEVPFGAMAPLLPADERLELAGGGAGEGSYLLRRFAATLSERAGGRRLVLLIDDAHLLDDASATLVYQLASSGTTKLLATIRSGERAPDAVLALWKDGLLDRLELDGLDGQAVSELLGEALGGPVDPAAVIRLAERGQGNVLFLRELVLGAVASGALVCDGGLWHIVAPLAPSRRLVELVEARLGELSDAQRGLLEAVALGGPLSTAELAAVGDLDLAESLERAGLLLSRTDGRRLEFRLAHSIHGEVLRQRLSDLRRRNIAESLAAAVEATGCRRAGDDLRVATLRLDAGGATAEQLVTAAATARERADLAVAERLLRAAVLEGAGFAASVEAARLASLRGRGDEAETEMAELAFEATDDNERGTVAVARVDNLRLLGRFAEAVAVAADADATIADTRWRDEVAARRAGLLLETDGPLAADAAAAAVCETASAGTLALACLTSAIARVRLGRFDAAVEVATRSSEDPGGALALACAEARAHAGAFAEAEVVAEAEHARAVASGAIGAQACAAWLRAKVLVLQGRADAAARHAREAAALLGHLGQHGLLRDSLVTLALAEALRGEAGVAAEALRELDGLDMTWGGWADADVLAARAWTAVAAGDVPAASALLNDAAERAARSGDRVGEASALHDLARLGFARDVGPRLAVVAANIDGALAPARAAHVAALAASDATALEAASATFERLEAWLLAAEAAADAAVAWRRRADERRAAAAQRRGAALAERCDGAVTPALRGLETRGLLTPAERRVAMMAASGRPNRDIASDLFLSLRTVENRLHRIYEKLGIAGRVELASALQQ